MHICTYAHMLICSYAPMLLCPYAPMPLCPKSHSFGGGSGGGMYSDHFFHLKPGSDAYLLTILTYLLYLLYLLTIYTYLLYLLCLLIMLKSQQPKAKTMGRRTQSQAASHKPQATTRVGYYTYLLTLLTYGICALCQKPQAASRKP